MLPIWADFAMTFVQMMVLLLLGFALCNLKVQYFNHLMIALASALTNVVVYHSTGSHLLKILCTYGLMILAVKAIYNLKLFVSFITVMLSFVIYVAFELMILQFYFFIFDTTNLQFEGSIIENIIIVSIHLLILTTIIVALRINKKCVIDFSFPKKG